MHVYRHGAVGFYLVFSRRVDEIFVQDYVVCPRRTTHGTGLHRDAGDLNVLTSTINKDNESVSLSNNDVCATIIIIVRYFIRGRLLKNKNNDITIHKQINGPTTEAI